VAGVGGKDYVGLCSSCSNASSCCFRQKRGFDAIFCEMYVCDTDSAVVDDAGKQADSLAPVLNPGEFKGLCINCANRETCKLAKPEEGVWHCEEYC